MAITYLYYRKNGQLRSKNAKNSVISFFNSLEIDSVSFETTHQNGTYMLENVESGKSMTVCSGQLGTTLTKEEKPKKRFRNSNEFSLYIEKRAIEEGNYCYTVLLEYCEEEGIDPEDIAKSVNSSLKGKLEVEFAELGYLKQARSLFD